MNSTEASKQGIFLELNELQPLDLLLVAGTGTPAKVIVFGQEVARPRVEIAYSHAALLLSPSMLVEAIGDGIGITQLGKGVTAFNSLFAPESLAHTRFFARNVNGRIRVFARLDGVQKATVLRHVNAKAKHLSFLRQRVLEALKPFYLVQYSELGRLGLPIGLSDRAVNLLNRSLEFVGQGKVLPGPFCSELVIILLQAIDDVLSAERSDADQIGSSQGTSIGDLIPQNAAPNDLQFMTGWNRMIEGMQMTSDDLPGSPLLSKDLLGMVSLPSQLEQSLQSKVRLTEAYVKRLIETGWLLAKTEDILENTGHLHLLERIGEYITDVCDPLWRWMTEANKCIKTCPEARRSKGHQIRLDEPTFHERRTLKSWEIVEKWDGSPCSDVRNCKGIDGLSWESLVANYETWSSRHRSAEA